MTGALDTRDRILLVDDQKEIRDIVLKLLAYKGYEVVAASNGKEGLGLFLRSPCNLVITDLSMPEVDGLTLAFFIKKRSPHTPVVLMTGHELDPAQRGSVDFVMRKPFSLGELQRTVQMFLSR
jgi:CheY-like chemotaxis protein